VVGKRGGPIQDRGEGRHLVKFSDAMRRRISREVSRQTVKEVVGARVQLVYAGGHEAQEQEVERREE
jgi:hypothetical protein